MQNTHFSCAVICYSETVAVQEDDNNEMQELVTKYDIEIVYMKNTE